MTGHDRVKLGEFNRADALEAARRGLTRAELVEQRQRAAQLVEAARSEQERRNERISRRRDAARGAATAVARGTRIELDDREYETLGIVAAVTRRLMPLIEEAGAPTKMPTEWRILTEQFAVLECYRWGETYGRKNAVGELLAILDQTGGSDT